MDAVPSLSPDFYGGTQGAGRHLAEVHGHRRIALITGGSPMDIRERAWVDALHGMGLTPDCRVHAEWSTPGGRAAAAQLLTRYPDATAVFVAADQQAVGLISGLYAAGRRIPDDIAVASFDGSLTARFTVPPLTTVGVPFDAMAHDAVAQVLGAPVEHKVYPTTLIIRQSCGCPPASV